MRTSALKLSVYFSERERAAGSYLADALHSVYETHQVHTSVLLRGADGFGAHHHLHTDRLLSASENLPAVSIAVDARERIEAALPEVRALTAGGGLLTLERATLLSGSELRHLAFPAGPETPVKLTLYGGRGARTGGQAGYVTAVARLASERAAGASVLLAVDGMLHGRRRRARFWARNAEVPLMLIAIGSSARLAAALPALLDALDEPVATLERVAVYKAAGQAHLAPAEVPERDASGLANRQKLTVHVEERATHGGRPVHSELLLRLRGAGVAGVTVLRGVRGFYADREPFADRSHSLRRNVPVLVVAIDRPARVRAWWPLVDELTAEHGLVTGELVPTAVPAAPR
ncbi:MAG: DUF190 domain-containing protein [Actinomycetota bacterium]|nr:DUF190 domain-containing protein [Actinomycetota bacterium]